MSLLGMFVSHNPFCRIGSCHPARLSRAAWSGICRTLAVLQHPHLYGVTWWGWGLEAKKTQDTSDNSYQMI